MEGIEKIIKCENNGTIVLKAENISLNICDNAGSDAVEIIAVTDGILTTIEEISETVVISFKNVSDKKPYACVSLPDKVSYNLEVDMNNGIFHMFTKNVISIQKANVRLKNCRGLAKDIMFSGICPAKYMKVTSSGSENIHFNMKKRPSSVVELPPPGYRYVFAQ